MLYTIGHTESYNQYLREQGLEFRKLGKTETYVGGSVYKTFDEAKQAIAFLPDYSVWILDTTLNNVYEISGSFHLINSCRILPLLDTAEVI